MNGDDMFNMTPIGRERYELVSKYNLERFYQVQTGHIIIGDEQFGELWRVILFLKENPNWVLGHEDGYWFVTTIADIKEI